MDDLNALVPHVVRAAQGAGERLMGTWSPGARVADREELLGALARNEAASGPGLRRDLEGLRPGARWLGEDLETSPVPTGEWWVVDTVEGNVNHVHGLAQWCVSVTLLRDGAPVLAVVHQPVGEHTWTAVRGGGAELDGVPLAVSGKQGLDVAVVGTGQAEAGQDATYARIGASITAMLGAALLVHASVPSTFPMLAVASGQDDAFWLYAPTLPGVAAGVLLVTEAGGAATRVDGSSWAPGSPDLLVAAPGVHRAAVAVLTPL